MNMLGSTEQREYGKAFFMRWLDSPFEIGSICPSSASLAHVMAAQVPVAGDGSVLELGAGTGVITNALLLSGIEPDRLFVVEKNPQMIDTLRQRFPDVNVIQEDVARLARAIRNERDIHKVKCVVSGLPMLLFDNRKQYTILRQVFGLLAYGGSYLQFTYGLMPPVSRQVMARLGIKATRVSLVLKNAPPAFVWKLELLPSTISVTDRLTDL